MKLLALDTSTEHLSVACWRDGVVTSRECHAGQKHSELTLPMVRAVLDESGLDLANLDGLAFCNGPGSFTGLRIGCGLIQGLAFAHHLPVVGINSLMALAQDCGGEKVITCMDARMNQVYFAAYQRNHDGWQTVIAPGLYDPDTTPSLPGDSWYAVGNGFTAFADMLQTRYGTQLIGTDPSRYPLATAIAPLAARALAAGQGQPAHEATLLYLRDKVALTVHEQPRK
ncbi:tRNA (adenosine(37)-N6)-threonylcarbamoyltransferase complex dimerization subunit type 1 TsaB [Chitinivorax sp. B]|uniref:tRNA (adenosine(37)-N6)-threonylcarbamoyltransferase complex dimerization subunit type 1 TsaB n=1 Tax=Chitinivorax sp. B TaxID=2502235 RepID=UPI0010F8EDC0|nr:tRNA (adenosine(37)-N6)-threonylcarbamoyltransferase complex dimerization subunit type 1 TsaB [Chitinivorax sp. B]